MSVPALSLREFFRTWLRWQPGRQGTGYAKLLLLTGRRPLPFDCYLLRYRPGQGIPPHTDPVPGFRHYRANLILASGREGGAFQCQSTLYSRPRLHIFRSDLSTHAVEPMVRGTRYVLSVGWLRPEPHATRGH